MGPLAHLQQPLQHGYTVDAHRSIRRTEGPASRARGITEHEKVATLHNAQASSPSRSVRRFAMPCAVRALAGPPNSGFHMNTPRTGPCFHFQTASYFRRTPLGGLLQQLLPQRGVRSRRWDQSSGPALQKQLVVRYKRLSCAASLLQLASNRPQYLDKVDETLLPRVGIITTASPPTSRPPPQPSRTSLGLNRSCCSAGAGELPNYNPDV